MHMVATLNHTTDLAIMVALSSIIHAQLHEVALPVFELASQMCREKFVLEHFVCSNTGIVLPHAVVHEIVF